MAVLEEQLGRVPAARVALALGHRRRRAASGYFEMTPAPGERVSGLLLEGLSRAEIERLDRFEGVATGAYRRAQITVRAFGSEAGDVTASAYLAPER